MKRYLLIPKPASASKKDEQTEQTLKLGQLLKTDPGPALKPASKKEEPKPTPKQPQIEEIE